jgi:hypothetical protein
MGLVLLALMGQNALIGALGAVGIGVVVWLAYGARHAHDFERITPFSSFRAEFANPTSEAHARFYAAFHAADVGRKNHLTLSEFRSAVTMGLGMKVSWSEIRAYFHEADNDADGVVDIDEFLRFLEEEE